MSKWFVIVRLVVELVKAVIAISKDKGSFDALNQMAFDEDNKGDEK